MIKIYTHQSCYENIKQYLREGQFEMIKTYLSVCLNGLQLYANELSYKNVAEPVYRGIKPETVQSLEDYEVGSIGLWP